MRRYRWSFMFVVLLLVTGCSSASTKQPGDAAAEAERRSAGQNGGLSMPEGAEADRLNAKIETAYRQLELSMDPTAHDCVVLARVIGYREIGGVVRVHALVGSIGILRLADGRNGLGGLRPVQPLALDVRGGLDGEIVEWYGENTYEPEAEIPESVRSPSASDLNSELELRVRERYPDIKNLPGW